MADQVNGGGNADPSGNPAGSNNEEAGRAQASQQPADTGDSAGADAAGTGADNKTTSDKTEVLEEVQRDAAKEREENRGYQ